MKLTETPPNHLEQQFCHLGNGRSIHLSYGSANLEQHSRSRYFAKTHPGKVKWPMAIPEQFDFVEKWRSRRESNADTRIRNPLLYPFELREQAYKTKASSGSIKIF